jgi:hypothetical protein
MWSYKLEHKQLHGGLYVLAQYEINDFLSLAGVKYVELENGHIGLYDKNNQPIEGTIGNLIHRVANNIK